MNNPISYGGFIVKNLLEPSAFSVRDYAKSAKMSPALRNLNFSKESPQKRIPKLTVISSFIDFIHIFFVFFNFVLSY